MKNGGKPCAGHLKEISPCVKKVDCVVSAWTEWDDCDKSCDGGQHSRHRQVVSNPLNGGKACPTEVVQTQGCNEQSCFRQDCQMTSWSEFGDCSVTCGEG